MGVHIVAALVTFEGHCLGQLTVSKKSYMELCTVAYNSKSDTVQNAPKGAQMSSRRSRQTDRQTDRQRATNMSPLCNFHKWTQ